MKFEIDPNELTTDQRAHVAAFITNWPVVKLDANKVRAAEESVKSILNFEPTEEQRLDSEQKADMCATEQTNEVNLNAIFGAPDATPGKVVILTNESIPLDKEGLPWDFRIHASTKTLIADGSWKLRRGVDPTEVESVKAQLKELMAVPQALVTDLHRGAATVSIPGLAEIVRPISGNVGIPAPTGYVVPQAQVDRAFEVDVEKEAVEQYAAKNAVTLTDLIGRMSAAIAAGKLTQASIMEICTKHGVSEFHLLGNRPDLLPLIDVDMKAMGV